MGEYKHIGDPAAALAEECSEVIKVITKRIRFNGKWTDVPPGEGRTRWAMLYDEMEDVLFQWQRLKDELIKDHLENGPAFKDLDIKTGLINNSTINND